MGNGVHVNAPNTELITISNHPLKNKTTVCKDMKQAISVNSVEEGSVPKLDL